MRILKNLVQVGPKLQLAFVFNRSAHCTPLFSDSLQADSHAFLGYQSASFATACAQFRVFWILKASSRNGSRKRQAFRWFPKLHPRSLWWMRKVQPRSFRASDAARSERRMAEDAPPSVSAVEPSSEGAPPAVHSSSDGERSSEGAPPAVEPSSDGEPSSEGERSSEGAPPAPAGRSGVRPSDIVWFRISESVKLAIHRGDITAWSKDGETDAIVNAANSRMLGGGGVDGAIHNKAGPKLLEACRQVPEVRPGVRCPPGEARVTKAFDLPVSRVIHTVGPIYFQDENPAILLRDAYRNSLAVATEEGIKYIAFPAISCGIYAYPIEEAANVSLSTIKESSEGISEIHFVLFDQKTYFPWLEQAKRQFGPTIDLSD